MIFESLDLWLTSNPAFAPWVLLAVAAALNALAFVIARNFIARGLVYLTERSTTQVDDTLVRYMRPYRFAWLAPLC